MTIFCQFQSKGIKTAETLSLAVCSSIWQEKLISDLNDKFFFINISQNATKQQKYTFLT